LRHETAPEPGFRRISSPAWLILRPSPSSRQ
jgi:hypothetical protein